MNTSEYGICVVSTRLTEKEEKLGVLERIAGAPPSHVCVNVGACECVYVCDPDVSYVYKKETTTRIYRVPTVCMTKKSIKK